MTPYSGVYAIIELLPIRDNYQSRRVKIIVAL